MTNGLLIYDEILAHLLKEAFSHDFASEFPYI
jgi:hypothetical protein